MSRGSPHTCIHAAPALRTPRRKRPHRNAMGGGGRKRLSYYPGLLTGRARARGSREAREKGDVCVWGARYIVCTLYIVPKDHIELLHRVTSDTDVPELVPACWCESSPVFGPLVACRLGRCVSVKRNLTGRRGAGSSAIDCFATCRGRTIREPNTPAPFPRRTSEAANVHPCPSLQQHRRRCVTNRFLMSTS